MMSLYSVNDSNNLDPTYREKQKEKWMLLYKRYRIKAC